MARRPHARKSSPLYLPSAFDLFKPSKDLVLKNIHVFGPLFILPFIFWGHSWLDIPANGGHYWNRFTDANYGWSLPTAYWVAFIGFSIIWFLIAVVGGTIVQIMLQRAQLDAAENREPQLGKLWGVTKKMWKPMVLLFLTMILIIGIGFIFLIVPGLILLRRYFFAPYVMLERKCSVREALDRSAHLSAINTGSVWGLIGVMFLIGLLGIVPIIGSLASFVAGSLYSVAPALRYQQLKKLA